MKNHCITIQAPSGKLFSVDVDDKLAMQLEIEQAEVFKVLAEGELDDFCDAIMALEDGKETIN